MDVQSGSLVIVARLDIVDPGTSPRLYEDRSFISHQVIARLADGSTREQAGAAVSAVMARIAEDHPESNRGRGGAYTPVVCFPFQPAIACRGGGGFGSFHKMRHP